MRITGGSLKNRSLKVAPNGIRPTSHKVRQAIFNILYSHGYELNRFLDCCAGSGSIGFEALSRGAQTVGFIENHKKNFDILQSNAYQLDVVLGCEFFLCSADVLFPCNTPYDIAFIDPPYQDIQLYEAIVFALHTQQWLTSDALVIMEMDKRYTINFPKPFSVWKEYHYGQTRLIFLEYTLHI